MDEGSSATVVLVAKSELEGLTQYYFASLRKPFKLLAILCIATRKMCS
jgi:hypothetical protein